MSQSPPVPRDHTSARTPPRIFIVCGEHSGDALGGRLIEALRHRLGDELELRGVGGEDMARQGVTSLYPISDVAVMGPVAIAKSLPLIYRRVHQTVDAIAAFRPDVLVIIDSPEFTHPIAKRVRKRCPDIKIVDYVSPSVWAWRPGRAKRMRRYCDLILALLPFEPDAHRRLGGPPCVYVGHALSERVDEIRAADGAALRTRLGLSATKPVVLVLPGSRRSEVSLLMATFEETVAKIKQDAHDIEVIIPTVAHLAAMVEERAASWRVKPHFVRTPEDKFAAMQLASAALAASGTVTLELAIAGTPTVVAYKVDRIVVLFRSLLKVESIVLANLVAGRIIFPEFLQERCTADLMSKALIELIEDTPARRAQTSALEAVPDRLKIDAENPSLAAADAILDLMMSGERGA